MKELVDKRKILWQSFGGKKGRSNAVVKAERISIDLEPSDRGVLISLALPTDKKPKYYPVIKRKKLFVRPVVKSKELSICDGDGVKVLERVLYGAGSFFEDRNEYEGYDIIPKDGCSFSLFVRPLLVDVKIKVEGGE